jgi:PAS domain S-box-containing protein
MVGVIEAKCPRCKRIVYLQEFESITNSEESFMVILSLEGSILGVNGVSDTILGYSTQDVIGISLAEVMPPEYRETISFWLAKIRQSEGSKNPYMLAIIPIISSSGAEFKLSFAAKCVELDGRKVVLGLAEVGEHIVDKFQRRITAHLASSPRKQREAWDFIISSSGIITHSSGESLLGYKEGELLGDDILGLIKNSEIPPESLKEKIKNLESFSFRSEVKISSGTVVSAEVCFMKDYLADKNEEQGLIVAFKL